MQFFVSKYVPSFEGLWMCHYYTLSKMCLSFFKIQDLGQSRSKNTFFQKHTCMAFSFLFPSVLLSCKFKSKTSNVICPAIFLNFWMVWTKLGQICRLLMYHSAFILWFDHLLEGAEICQIFRCFFLENLKHQKDTLRLTDL